MFYEVLEIGSEFSRGFTPIEIEGFRYKDMIEKYSIENELLARSIQMRDGSIAKSYITSSTSISSCNPEDYDKAWLMSKKVPVITDIRKSIRMVDLFSGAGLMTLGVIEAGRATGVNVEPVFAIDFEKNAADNYALNFPGCHVVNDDILKFVDGELGTDITEAEKNTLRLVGNIDMVIGGPPCQGHSDLNNHTRRDDPRNQLIFRVVRFVELTKPKLVVIENVQGIKHDKNHVLQTAEEYLLQLGYHLHENLLMASKFGVAQNRRRFILVATLHDIPFDLSPYQRENVNGVWWAIDDLRNTSSDKAFDTSAKHSKVNQERIEYLFEHNLYELPNQLRPKCQQREDNRYTSVYSRMYADNPAPTITSGFGSIGQGRFGHPYEKRTLTPHEAARVQFIPDYFKFDSALTRVALQKMIGNAVPPKLTYIIGLELFR